MANIQTFRIVLLGKTGNGKSRTANTILGKNVFEFSAQSQSVTKLCQKNETDRFGKHICVVDTPGVFDTRTDNVQVQEEIKKCISLTTPGPHAIILCVPIGRFTQEDIDAVTFFLQHFGESMMRYVIVLFTRFDDWKRDNAEENIKCQDIDGYINSLSDSLKSFLQKSSNRYIPFDNTLKEADSENQVNNLLSIIENMVRENGSSHYTNSDYQKAERKQKEEEEKIKAQQERDRLLHEERIRKQREEELRREHEEKEKQLQAQLDQARQEQEAAARRRRRHRRHKNDCTLQ